MRPSRIIPAASTPPATTVLVMANSPSEDTGSRALPSAPDPHYARLQTAVLGSPRSPPRTPCVSVRDSYCQLPTGSQTPASFSRTPS